MGKRSIKENKNIYFQIRDDELGLTRAQAAERMDTISESRLEKIEYEEAVLRPEDVVEMAKAYGHPELCNHYCSHECAIGRDTVDEIKVQSLSEITLKMLASINDLNYEKNRLIEITADGVISDDEIPDFVRIQKQLESISQTVDSLKLWVDSTVANGKIDAKKLEKAQNA